MGPSSDTPVLLHRVSALARALLFVGGLALTALGSGAHAVQAQSIEHQHTAHREPGIESRGALPADDLRAGEQVEVVSNEVRSVLRPPIAGAARAKANRTPSGRLRTHAQRWCDVIQCRRLGGALLLGFATPPPPHS